jgi:hypothetical protein
MSRETQSEDNGTTTEVVPDIPLLDFFFLAISRSLREVDATREAKCFGKPIVPMSIKFDKDG